VLVALTGDRDRSRQSLEQHKCWSDRGRTGRVLVGRVLVGRASAGRIGGVADGRGGRRRGEAGRTDPPPPPPPPPQCNSADWLGADVDVGDVDDGEAETADRRKAQAQGED
jgi:hypothetical protein